jgi:uncharacterized membrane protein YagU involved in acid resistance
MVEFAIGPALLAGLVATLVMTALMEMGRRGGMTSMEIALLVGGMLTKDESKARRIGMVLHVAMMGTVVFGIGYALLFQALDSDSVATGLIIGLVHGAVVGVMGMPMMAAIHPRMRADAGGFTMETPGVFGVHYGGGTPLGLVMGHAVYGVVVAIVYGAAT